MVNSDLLAVESPICVGIIGGGQLGKMIAHEARRMSLKVIVLDPTEGCPASDRACKFHDPKGSRGKKLSSPALTRNTLHNPE
jgi:5-(carboxyamino)imidazole ribonucleotide synthase